MKKEMSAETLAKIQATKNANREAFTTPVVLINYQRDNANHTIGVYPYEDEYFVIREDGGSPVKYFPNLEWACKQLLDLRISDTLKQKPNDVMAAIAAARLEVVSAIGARA